MINKNELLDRLEFLTSEMDIPIFRTRSVVWLNRNIHFRNQDHPNFKEAREILNILMKMGVRN